MKKERLGKILVVDDNETNRYTMARFLSRAGFEVDTASNGEEGLRKAQSHPDLILLDIQLPDINGFEVCRTLKKHSATSRIPILQTSATFVGLESKIQSLEGGADGYLTMPVEPAELVATVRAFIRVRRAEAEAQEVQMRLSLAQKAARIGTFEWNVLTDEVSWTTEMECLYGLDPGSFCNTQDGWRKRVHPADYASLENDIQSAFKTGKVEFQAEFRILWPDQSVRWMLARSQILRDESGQPTKVIGVNIDITERKIAEQSIEQAQKKLQEYADHLEERVEERTAKLKETIQDLEAFSYSVSHDLRAPLRAMQSYSQFLLEDFGKDSDTRAKEYLNRIISAATRLDRLIQDILTYSRVARTDIDVTPIHLDTLFKDIIEQYPNFHGREEGIIIHPPLGTVFAHEGALTQCISNLLSNAIKFVPPNTRPRIEIWTESIGPDIRIFFKDNGLGINPDHLKKIFKMFERVHAGEHFEGTGIGLAVVKKGVERMGGEVGVMSEINKGSTFWIQLRRA